MVFRDIEGSSRSCDLLVYKIDSGSETAGSFYLDPQAFATWQKPWFVLYPEACLPPII